MLPEPRFRAYNQPVANPSPTLRDIPSVDRVLQHEQVRALLETYPRDAVRGRVQEALQRLRGLIQNGELSAQSLQREFEEIPLRLARRLGRDFEPSLRRIVNATGIIIHTNAGRAPLSPRVAQAVAEIASGYSNLELDIDTGRRGHRDQHLEARLCRLLDCRAATVCNNNAAAVFLILNTFARGRNVIVSRGELVEIGGSFRVPDIMNSSGAELREVGTTNRTRISDYRRAIDEQTGLILKVHPSNYRIVGFSESPSLAELVELSRETGVPTVHDVGSGLLFPSNLAGLASEPSVADSLRAGIDLVCFSGDKLLGGPQSGIVAGNQAMIGDLRQNPMMRALRVDKMCYAALDRTLLEIEKGCPDAVPVAAMLATTLEETALRAQALVERAREFGFDAETVDGHSLAGGGSAPEERIPTRLAALRFPTLSTVELERSLRAADPPILCRIEEDRLLLDPRTVLPGEEALIVKALERVSRL